MNSHVNRMIIDEWAGVYCDEQEVRSPGFEELIELFRKLDGKVHTLLVLDAPNGARLMIGGGAGRYVVSATVSEQEFWNLLSEVDKHGAVVVTTGGQDGEFPARQVVDEAHAIQAAKTFLSSAKLDSNLLWEKQT